MKDIGELERLRLGDVANKVFAVDKTGDLVKRTAIYGHPRIAACSKAVRYLLKGAGFRHGDDRGSRDHRFFYSGLGKFEYLVDESVFFLVYLTAFLRQRYKLTDLVLGVDRSVIERSRKSDNFADEAAGVIEYPKYRREDLCEELQGPGRDQGKSFSAF